MQENIYRRMYLHLFNQVTEAVCALEAGQRQRALRLLIEAQVDTEELYLEYGETEQEQRERW